MQLIIMLKNDDTEIGLKRSKRIDLILALEEWLILEIMLSLRRRWKLETGWTKTQKIIKKSEMIRVLVMTQDAW